MSTVLTPGTWEDDDVLTYAALQRELYDPARLILRPPRVWVRRATAQSLPHATTTPVEFTEAVVDDDEMWSAATPTRITPKLAGWWVGTVGGGYAATNTSADTDGYRMFRVQKNGSTSITNNLMRYADRPRPNVNSAARYNGLPFIGYFNGTTDYCDFRMYHNAGASLNTDTDERHQPVLKMRWLAP